MFDHLKNNTLPQILIAMFVSIYLKIEIILHSKFYREFNVSVIALEIPFRRFLNGQEVFLQFKQCASITISNADTFQTFYLKVSSISWRKCRQIEAFRGKSFGEMLRGRAYFHHEIFRLHYKEG